MIRCPCVVAAVTSFAECGEDGSVISLFSHIVERCCLFFVSSTVAELCSIHCSDV